VEKLERRGETVEQKNPSLKEFKNIKPLAPQKVLSPTPPSQAPQALRSKEVKLRMRVLIAVYVEVC
jgi:hypothetical protein